VGVAYIKITVGHLPFVAKLSEHRQGPVVTSEGFIYPAGFLQDFPKGIQGGGYTEGILPFLIDEQDSLI